MDFKKFLNEAWNDHGTKADEVAARFTDGLKLITENDQIPSMAQIVAHVYGEHLFDWSAGVEALHALEHLPVFVRGSESDKAVARLIAALEIGSGELQSVEDFSLSDQVRVLAVAASALANKGDLDRAMVLLRGALENAQSGLPKGDPANRAMAVTGNNLASALEEKVSRTAEEREMMILAAQIGRKFWEIAGSWLEVSRAEYRLAMTYTKADELTKALGHALTCIEICTENNADPIELFFGYEALAVVERARGNTLGFGKAVEHAKICFEKLSSDDRSWCEESLKKLL